jgi:hypothetical protein
MARNLGSWTWPVPPKVLEPGIRITLLHSLAVWQSGSLSFSENAQPWGWPNLPPSTVNTPGLQAGELQTSCSKPAARHQLTELLGGVQGRWAQRHTFLACYLILILTCTCQSQNAVTHRESSRGRYGGDTRISLAAAIDILVRMARVNAVTTYQSQIQPG